MPTSLERSTDEKGEFMPRVREAQWVTVREFPNYEISDRGEIFNTKTRQPMRTSRNNHGHVKITLTDWEGVRHTRSVAQMVAEVFVKSPNFMCDNVMVLDGDLTNVCADNLAWRPRGFVWEYSRQLKIPQPPEYRELPVRNVIMNFDYDSIVEAGMTEGLLFKDIWRSTYSGCETFPHGSIFEIT